MAKEVSILVLVDRFCNPNFFPPFHFYGMHIGIFKTFDFFRWVDIDIPKIHKIFFYAIIF